MAALLILFWAEPGYAADEVAPADREIDFSQEIQPILAESCCACHGADKHEGGLRLHRRSEALAGGDRGLAIVPGKSGESRLISFITGENDEKLVMPPPGDFARLTEAQVALLRKWIDQGAKWPDAAEGSDRSKQHWSFQPIARPPLPEVKHSDSVRNPIDRFVLARLAVLYNEALSLCQSQPDAAARLAGSPALAGVPIPKAAAWVAICRTVLNLDEFVTRE